MTDTNQISPNPERELIPKRMIRALLALLISVLLLVAWARVTDRPMSGPSLDVPILQERVIQLSGEINGSALILAEDGTVIAEFASGEAVFISTIARVMARERFTNNADQNAPFILRLREGNRLTIFDPETGQETELSSFGKDNVASFRAVLDLP